MSLQADGAAILSQERGIPITLKSYQSNSGTDYLLTVGSDGVTTAWEVRPRNGRLQYFSGPSGSDIIVIRGQAGHTDVESTGALDLRSGFWLRTEERGR